MKKGIVKRFLGIFLASALTVQSVMPVQATDISGVTSTFEMSSEEVDAYLNADEPEPMEANEGIVDDQTPVDLKEDSGVNQNPIETEEDILDDQQPLEQVMDIEPDKANVLNEGESADFSNEITTNSSDKFLTLEANGGSFSEDYQLSQVGYENNYGYIGMDLYRNGYAFTGWYYDPECTNLASIIEGSDQGSYRISKDLGGITLYAGWTSDYYTVVFDATSEGRIRKYPGDTNGMQTKTVLIPKNALWKLTGYINGNWYDSSYIDFVGEGNKKFKCWVDDKGNSYSSIYNYQVQGDIVFTAQFEGAFLVTFKAGDGVFPDSVNGFYGGRFNAARDEAAIMVKENSYLGTRTMYSSGEVYYSYLPPDPVSNDPDKSFIGWYSSDGNRLEGTYLYNYLVTEDVVFEARYESNVTITFDAGSGTIEGNSQFSYKILPGSSMKQVGLSVPADPVRTDGEIFAGWYKDPEFQTKIEKWDIINLIIDKDITFYAKYSKTVHVYFSFHDDNAGDEDVTYSIDIACGDIIGSKAPNVSARYGTDSFTGWYRDKECTIGPINLYEPVTEDTYLYAGYKENDYYTITFKTGKDGVTFINGENEVKLKVKKGQPLLYDSMVNSSPVVDYNSAAKATGQVPTGYWESGSDRYFFTSPEYMINTSPQVVRGNDTALLPYTGFVPTCDMVFVAEWKKKIVITFQAPSGTSISSYFPVMRDGKVVYANSDPYLEYDAGSGYTKLLYTTYAGRKINEFAGLAPRINSQDVSYTWGANSSGKALDTSSVINSNTTIYALKLSISGGGNDTPLETIATVTLHAPNAHILDPNNNDYGETRVLNIRSWSEGMAFSGFQVVPNDSSKIFSGWYTDPECNNAYEHIRYQNGYEIISFPYEITDLYAGMETPINVDFNANGGYFDDNDKIYSGVSTGVTTVREKAAPGKKVNVVSVSKRIRNNNNKIFDGWYEDQACTVKAKTEMLDGTGEYYTPKSSTTLFAKWVNNPKSIPVITIEPASLKLNIGGTGKLHATITGEATGSVKYYIANINVGKTNTKYQLPASIDSEGNIFAQAEGSVSVYAEVNGARSANAIISVSPKIDVSVGKITYNLGGGVNNEANPDYFNNPYSVELKTPTRDGYDFAGWFTDAKFTMPVDNETFAIVQNITVYAKWESKNITAFFEANGGYFGEGDDKTSEQNVQVKYGSVYPKGVPTENPKRIGYTFAGWFTAAEGGTKIVPGTTKVVTSNYGVVRVYAHWTKMTYTIRFNSNPASGKNVTKPQKAYYDEATKLNDNTFKQAGASFIGWNTKADGSGKNYSDKENIVNLVSGKVANDTIDLYAQWKYVDYVVFFDTGVEYGNSYEQPNNGTLEVGGFSYPETSREALEEANIDLSVTYHRSGFLQALKYGESFEITCEEFKKDGWTLTGWKNLKTGKVISKGTIKDLTTTNEVVILVAQWKMETYKVTYDLNGGSFVKGFKAPNSYNIYTSETQILPGREKMYRKGYTFDGWYDNKNFEGYEFISVNENTDPNHYNPVFKNKTFYAKWKPIKYHVSLEPIVETIEENVVYDDVEFDLDYDETHTLLPDAFERHGYYIDSWNTREDGKGKKYAANAVIKNLLDGSDERDYILLYAMWKPVKYTIRYDLDGGRQSGAPSTYEAGKRVELKTPTKTGFVFEGWEPDDQAIKVTTVQDKKGTKYYIEGSEECYGNVTLKAKWRQYSYTVRLHYNRAGYDDIEPVTICELEYGKNYEIKDFAKVAGEKGWPEADKINYFNTKSDGKGSNYSIGEWFSRSGANGEVIELYAQWKDRFIFTISYELDGGTITKPFTAYDRSKDVAIADPVKPGYTFKGWKISSTKADDFEYVEKDAMERVEWRSSPQSTDATTGVLKKLKILKSSNMNITLTATYTENVRTITVDPSANDARLLNAFTDANGKIYPENSSFKKASIGKYTYSSDAALPVLVRKGYVFKGLYTDKSGKSKQVTTAGALNGGNSVTLYAVWAPKEYIIRFNNEVAGAINQNATDTDFAGNDIRTIKYGQKLTLKNPTAKGYTFLGWALKDTSTEGSVSYNDPTAINITKNKQDYVTGINATNNCNVDLEAKWSENSYTIKISANGGKALNTKQNPSTYALAGNRAFTADVTDEIAEETRLFIKTEDTTATYSKKGFVFIGFATDAKGKNMVINRDGSVASSYKDTYKQNTISRLSPQNKATVTLYAIWEKVEAYEIKIIDCAYIDVVSYCTYTYGFLFDVPESSAETYYELQASSTITFRDSVTKTTILTQDELLSQPGTGYLIAIGDTQEIARPNNVRIRQVKIDEDGNRIYGKWTKRIFLVDFKC